MNFQPLVHQAAGHAGCLTSEGVFAKMSSPQEIDFYAETQRRIPGETEIPQGSHISHWMPTFMGTLQLGEKEEAGATTILADPVEEIQKQSEKTPRSEIPYIVLNNLYYGFLHVNVLDVKLGAELCDDTVTPEKWARLAEVSRLTTLGSLHFRVCGMETHNSANSANSANSDISDISDPATVTAQGDYIRYNKFYGRALTKETVPLAFRRFLAAARPEFRQKIALRFLQRLQLLYNCLLDTEIRLFSGSLLFLYDLDPQVWESAYVQDNYEEADPLILELDLDSDDEEDTSRKAPLSSLSLIDFAHAKYADGQGYDENIIVGVENLMNIFQDIVEELS